MKLAYSCNAYMKCTILEAIERVAALGYRGVEIMADAPHVVPGTATAAEVAAVRSALDRHALSVSNVNAFMMNAVGDFWHPSWIDPDSAARRLRIEHTRRALGLASALSARCVTTEPGGPVQPGMTPERALDLFVDGLTDVLPDAEREGIMLLVEPEPGLLIENAAQFLELADRVASPALGLNFDVGHFFCVSDPLPQTVERLKGYTRHYHIEDIAASRVHEHRIPGTGAIDFEALLRAIRATGYDGWLTVELYPYQDDPDGAGRQARDFLTPLLERR